MTTREALHSLLDDLPDSLLDAAGASLRALKQPTEDPFLAALREAPIDDEPETDEELEALRESRDSKGERSTHDEVKRLIGL